MEKETRHLNLLDLFQESKERLSLIEAKDRYSEDDSLLFLFGKEIPVVSEKKYVSILSIENKNEEIYYPLYYCLLDEQKIVVETLEFNQLALQFLTDLGIMMKEDLNINEIQNLYSYIKKEIDRIHANDKVSIVFHFTFVDGEVLLYNKAFPFLYDLVFNNAQDKKYEALFRELKTQKQEDEVFDQSFGFFAKQIRVLERINQYQGTRVTIREKSILHDFLNRLFDYSLDKKIKVLIVSDEKETGRVFSYLKQQNLQDFAYLIQDERYSHLLSLLKDRDFQSVTRDEEYEYNTILQKEEQFHVYEDKREECFSYPKPWMTLAYFREIESQNSPSSHTYPLNAEGYQGSEFENDEKFCLLLDELETVKSTYITNHPYYGLTSRNTRVNYDSLQLLIISIMNKIRDIEHFLEEDNPIKAYGLKAETLKDVKNICEDGRILQEYNGFPRKYFRLNQDTESKFSLSQLKEQFQTLSSTKTILMNLCGEGIFSQDLNRLVLDYSSNKFFIKRKAKKELERLCKNQKDYVPSLVEVILKYLHAQKEIQEVLPAYIEVYGDSVSTMNGVLEIQSNVNYIHQFNQRGKENPNFHLENPFVKRCLRDKEFRVASVSFIEELRKEVEELTDDLNQYQKYFLDIRDFGFENQPLPVLLQTFSQASLLTFEEFSEYALFKERLEDTSLLLQLTLGKYKERKQTLEHFGAEFRISLLKSYYSHGKEIFSEYVDRYYKAFSDYQYSLLHMAEKINRHRYGLYEKEVEEWNNSLVYRNQKQRILEESARGFSYQDKLDLWNLIISNYPLCVVDSKDLHKIPNDLFDLVVTFESEKFSHVELVNAYRVGEKTMFISTEEQSDDRIQGYHQSVISREAYTKAFDFDRVPEKFLQYLKEECEKHQMILEQESAAFPLLIVDGERQFAIVPDILLTHEYDRTTLSELARYLAMYENIMLYCLDTYEFLFEPENLFKALKYGKEA